MAQYIARRLLQAVPVLLLASIAVFALVRAVPGDPALILAGPEASPETIEAIRRSLALDQGVLQQYVSWLGQVITGDLGESIVFRTSVTELIAQALVPTLQLVVAALVLAVVLGLTLGLTAALNRGGFLEVAIGGLNALLLGTPAFWVGLVGLLVFSVILGWVPAGGWVPFSEDFFGALQRIALPAVVLSLPQAAVLARFVRNAMLDVLGENYVRTAEAKGLGPATVIARHSLRNALVPVVTVLGIQVGSLIGGAVVVEQVFSWPGMGRLIVGAIGSRDYPLVQATLLFLVVAFVLINLVTDLLYGYLDPRIRASQ